MKNNSVVDGQAHITLIQKQFMMWNLVKGLL